MCSATSWRKSTVDLGWPTIWRATRLPRYLWTLVWTVDDLQPQSRVQVVEVAVEPVANDRVARALEDLTAKGSPLEHRRHVQDGVLGIPSQARVGGAHRLVGLEQREHGEAEGVLHAWSPEAVELPAEDAQGVGGGLVAIPAQADVEQVDAEWPAPIGHVQVHDVGLPLARHQR